MTTAIQRLQQTNKNHRSKMHELEARLVRSATTALTGGAYGIAARKGVPMVVGGIPVKPAVAALAMGGALMTRGPMARFLAAVGDFSLGLYVFEGTKQGTLVAGIENVGDGGDL